ncbi:STAS domain-containing protein [Nocardia sp. NPDC003183]
MIRALPVKTSASRQLAGDLEPCGQVMILRTHGEIDAHSAPVWQHLLDDALAATADSGRRRLLVDLSETTFVSLSAIADLARHRCPSTRAPVTISVLDRHEPSTTARIVTATGLSSYLEIFPDLPTALRSPESADEGALAGSLGDL